MLGTWTLNGNGNWSTPGNWQNNAIADGVGATAHFTLSLSSNRNFTFDTTSRTLGTLNASATGRSSNFLTSGGAVLTMDNTGSTNAVINVDSGSGQNQNVNVPIQLMDSLDLSNGLTSASGKSLIMNNTISSKNGALTITNTSVAGGGSPSTNFNGIISDGTGSISFVNAAGFINVNAANTFSGSTTNTSGIFRLDNALALQNSAVNTTASAAGNASNGFRINTGVTTLTLGGLTGNKNFAATGGVFTTTTGNYANVTALTLNPGTGKSYSYDGAIENGAANMTLTKTGAGTQTLNGTSTYSGDTLVSVGTLLVNGSLTSAANDVSVINSATLGGSGSIAGTLSFGGSSFFDVFLTQPLTVAGTVSFGSGFGFANLKGIDWDTVLPGAHTILTSNQDFSSAGLANYWGSGNAVPVGTLGRTAYFQNEGSLQGLQVMVAQVPEPTTLALLAAGLAGLLAAAWRLRKNN
jgi:autotransporter-associated beta strand protein